MSKEIEQGFWYVTCSYLKASVGMYHVCDCPYYSCLGTLWYCHPYFTLQFVHNFFFYTCYHILSYYFRYCNDTFALRIVILLSELVVMHDILYEQIHDIVRWYVRVINDYYRHGNENKTAIFAISSFSIDSNINDRSIENQLNKMIVWSRSLHNYAMLRFNYSFVYSVTVCGSSLPI